MGGKNSKQPKQPKEAKDKKSKDKKPEKVKAEKPPKVDKKKEAAAKAAALKQEDIDLVASNTNYNRDQIVAIHKDFVRDCPSAKINKKDFAKLFKQVHPLDKKTKVDKYCTFAFNAFDKNHDGVIDFPEFCVAFAVTSSEDQRQKVQFAFRHYDQNRDGKVNQKDILNVVSSLYDLNGIPSIARKGTNDPKKRVEEIFKQLDVNKKNTITSTEFVDGCLNHQAAREFLVDSLFSS